MELYLTDKQIQKLLEEEKVINLEEYQKMFKLSKEKKQHKEQEIQIHRDQESFFKVLIRCSKINQLDFTVIFTFGYYNSNQLFKLRRYNGKSHSHINKIEKNMFYDFHIHQATEKYQDIGFSEEHYAKKTDKYSDLRGAINLMISECNIIIPEGINKELF